MRPELEKQTVSRHKRKVSLAISSIPKKAAVGRKKLHSSFRNRVGMKAAKQRKAQLKIITNNYKKLIIIIIEFH